MPKIPGSAGFPGTWHVPFRTLIASHSPFIPPLYHSILCSALLLVSFPFSSRGSVCIVCIKPGELYEWVCIRVVCCLSLWYLQESFVSDVRKSYPTTPLVLTRLLNKPTVLFLGYDECSKLLSGPQASSHFGKGYHSLMETLYGRNILLMDDGDDRERLSRAMHQVNFFSPSIAQSLN